MMIGMACGGTWTGSVGAVFAKDNRSGRVYVREVPSDMGAARAGILVEDELVAIDGHPVRGMSTQQLHEALSGKVGTKVSLQIVRAGETRVVIVERGPLKGPPPAE
jgi:C-terminal processing protease CtpA/Prc